MKTWSRLSVAVLLFALAGCYESSPRREAETESSCRSERVCDFDSLICSSIFDEQITTYIDEYGDDFDRHTMLTDRTEVIRTDDIDMYEIVLGSTQTEVLTSTRREAFTSYDHDGREDIRITESTSVTTTTWNQDCPSCLVEVCTAADGGVERCVIETALPDVPVCQDP